MRKWQIASLLLKITARFTFQQINKLERKLGNSKAMYLIGEYPQTTLMTQTVIFMSIYCRFTKTCPKTRKLKSKLRFIEQVTAGNWNSDEAQPQCEDKINAEW